MEYLWIVMEIKWGKSFKLVGSYEKKTNARIGEVTLFKSKVL